MNAKEKSFIDVLERSIVNIEAEYLSNTKNINGAMALFFSGLKYFGNFGNGNFQTSPEKDVRAVGYKLGGLDKIQNDSCYFANVETLACVGVDASDGNE